MSHPRSARAAAQHRATRHPVVFVCHVVREHDGEGIAGVAVDFSTGGLQAVTRSRVLTGEPVRLTFQTPATGRWLTLRGTVARVLHGRRTSERGRRIGIQFEELAPGDAVRVSEASDRLDVMPYWL